MTPFPNGKYKAVQKKSGPFVNHHTKAFDKDWCFGFLPHDSKIEKSPDPCYIINKPGTYADFEWHGSPGSIIISSNDEGDNLQKRLRHDELDVELRGFFSEDIGIRALETFHKVKLYARNCAFRGNYKLNPLIENGIGQGNLIKINGSECIFEDCYFYNSINPILINANSQVTFKNCHFAVSKVVIAINGQPNPRRNDEIAGGKAGGAVATLENCTFFKCEKIAMIDEGGEVQADFDANVTLSGGKFTRI